MTNDQIPMTKREESRRFKLWSLVIRAYRFVTSVSENDALKSTAFVERIHETQCADLLLHIEVDRWFAGLDLDMQRRCRWARVIERN